MLVELLAFNVFQKNTFDKGIFQIDLVQVSGITLNCVFEAMLIFLSNGKSLLYLGRLFVFNPRIKVYLN